MLTIYRDSECNIHFARESIVDGRLIPMPQPEAIFYATPEDVMYEGVWIRPTTQKAADKPSTLSENLERTIKSLFKVRTDLSNIVWDIRHDMRPAWENYRRVADHQARYMYETTYEHKAVDMWKLIKDLYRVFMRTRKGFDADREMHPAVTLMLETYGAPANLAVLVSEQPTLPKEAEEIQKVSYFQNLEKMEKNIKTVGKLGKYLRRHWPSVSDVDIRNMTQRFAPVQFAIWDTMPDMIRAAQYGPQTCMKDSDFNDEEHPYLAYATEHGWAVAVTLKGDLIVGRAVVNKEKKIFTRSFRAHEDNPSSREYSYDDDRLEVWLTDQGYNRVAGWPRGMKLAKVCKDGYNEYWLPYLDGDCQRVDDCGGYLVTNRNGDYSADSASGYRDFEDSDNNTTTCDVCSEDVDEDDVRWEPVRNDGDTQARYQNICDCCRGNFTYVEGSAQGSDDNNCYYVPDGDAVQADDGEYLDKEYLPEDYILLEDDEVVREENAVYIEESGEWHRIDDAVLVTNSDGQEEYALKDECTECEHDGKMYKDDDVVYFGANCVANVNLEDWFQEQDDQACIISWIQHLVKNEDSFHTDRAIKILENWFNPEEIQNILNFETPVESC